VNNSGSAETFRANGDVACFAVELTCPDQAGPLETFRVSAKAAIRRPERGGRDPHRKAELVDELRLFHSNHAFGDCVVRQQ
jgi:hypothetical protein